MPRNNFRNRRNNVGKELSLWINTDKEKITDFDGVKSGVSKAKELKKALYVANYPDLERLEAFAETQGLKLYETSNPDVVYLSIPRRVYADDLA